MTATAQILPVDPSSPHFAPLVRLMEDVDRETVGDAYEPYDVDYERAAWVSVNGHHAGWVVLADDTVVAFATAFMPDRDNTHVVELEIGAAAAHRGLGHGRALLQVVSDHARSEGRDTLLGGTGFRPDPDVAWALHERAVADASVTRRPSPGAVLGVSFARASGADLVQTEMRSQVLLPVPADVLARQDAEVAAYADGYTARTWTGACPDDLLADRAALAARMDTDPPLGDMDWRPGVWDADRMRDTYADWARRGLLVVGAGAVSPEGRMVAFSEMGQDRRRPAVGSQFDTIVDPDHRGRRLGMLVKQSALRALADAAPQVERVQTWNALENGPMLRVNRAMGFVPVGLYALWQLKLT